MMRTIMLTEHKPARHILSESELAQLLAAKLVDISPLTGGMYELRAGSVVGTAVLPHLRLLIQPKVSLRNVFFLLGFGGDLARWAEEHFSYEKEPDLLSAVAWAFDAEVRAALGHGLVRGYQGREETLATLRGRIDIGSQLRMHQGRVFPLACRYEEYTQDVQLNRVLKAAHRLLLTVPGLDFTLLCRLRHGYRAFEDVALVMYSATEVPDLHFSRLDRHWETAGRLAALILRWESLRDRTGGSTSAAFTVDMNTLFERFVERVVREVARRRGWRLEAQANRSLSFNIGITPDLVLSKAGRDYAVGDAKYKDPSFKPIPHVDLYQLLAYCTALGLPRGLLIYAGFQPGVKHVVERAGISLEVVGIDMGAEPQAVLSQMRAVASRLVAHADGGIGSVVP